MPCKRCGLKELIVVVNHIAFNDLRAHTHTHAHKLMLSDHLHEGARRYAEDTIVVLFTLVASHLIVSHHLIYLCV